MNYENNDVNDDEDDDVNECSSELADISKKMRMITLINMEMLMTLDDNKIEYIMMKLLNMIKKRRSIML